MKNHLILCSQIIILMMTTLAACAGSGSTGIPPGTSRMQPVSTLDTNEVLLLFSEPDRIVENLTDLLQAWGLPDPQVAMEGGVVEVSYTQPTSLYPSEYREIYLLVFRAAERTAPFSSEINVTVIVNGMALYTLTAATADVASLRRGELTTNDFLDRMSIVLPEE